MVRQIVTRSAISAGIALTGIAMAGMIDLVVHPSGFVRANEADSETNAAAATCSPPKRTALPVEPDSFTTVTFSPDGELIAIGGGSRVELVSAAGEFLQTLESMGRMTVHVEFSPLGSTFTSVDANWTAKVWTRDGRRLSSMAGHRGIIYDASYSPNGNILATASADRTIRLWDVSRRQLDGGGQFVKHAGGQWRMDFNDFIYPQRAEPGGGQSGRHD